MSTKNFWCKQNSAKIENFWFCREIKIFQTENKNELCRRFLIFGHLSRHEEICGLIGNTNHTKKRYYVNDCIIENSYDFQLSFAFFRFFCAVRVKKILIVSYFEGEARVIAFLMKNGMNMRKIASHGKLNLRKLTSLSAIQQ